MPEHIFVLGTEKSKPYTGRGVPVKTRRMSRDPAAHSAFLQRQFNNAWTTATATGEATTAIAFTQREGVYLNVVSAADHPLNLDSLENRQIGIRLRTVHAEVRDGHRLIIATIFLPHSARASFLKKLNEYATTLTKKGGVRHAALLANIDDIVTATLRSFWPPSDQARIPDDQPSWCEIWLDLLAPTQAEEVESEARAIAEGLGVPLADRRIVFPERLVLLAQANRIQLEAFVAANSRIAEFRLAYEPAGFWTSESARDQAAWATNLAQRLEPASVNAPAVCVLDTGVTQAHPLLAPVCAPSDCLSVNPTWGTNDRSGHGTAMAGLAAHGRLEPLLADSSPIRSTHWIESVKLLPPAGHAATREDLYGDITSRAVSQIEITQPQRARAFCMAVSSETPPDQGKPTSWSARIDALAAGASDEQHRLFVLAAGNVPEALHSSYPASNQTQQISDPGQAWNALTVGAYTAHDRFPSATFPGHQLLATPGSLSPYSATGLSWQQSQWPNKPDIVMEGGNLLRAPGGHIVGHDDLDLLTAYYQPLIRTFTTTCMTSAACAQAANLAARVQAAYPTAWPETIRGLLVHSASWTDSMRAEFLDGNRRGDYRRLLQTVGFGVPDQAKAIACGRNSLTLVAERSIQPYCKNGSEYKTNEMHLHELPWPKAALQALASTARATVRVTLSYFTEPNPSERGWKSRYRYQGYGLRFALNRAGQSTGEFIGTINQAIMEDEDDGGENAGSVGDDRWLIGTQARHRGSLHADIWHGTAADVADCNFLAVYPVIGWWRERPHLGRVDSQARYSLIVSITTDDQAVDIYTPVKVQVETQIVV
jgi:hypothetical protein